MAGNKTSAWCAAAAAVGILAVSAAWAQGAVGGAGGAQRDADIAAILAMSHIRAPGCGAILASFAAEVSKEAVAWPFPSAMLFAARRDDIGAVYIDSGCPSGPLLATLVEVRELGNFRR